MSDKTKDKPAANKPVQQELQSAPKQEKPDKQVKESELKQEKGMRRIQQRQEMPTDKAQLIQYLSERIRQAEEALNDTEEVLQNQTGEREKIAKSIEERNTQISKLYEVDQKGLPQKIKERLTEILTQTINQKLQAEDELQQEKSKNYEYNSRYKELKNQQQKLKHKLDELTHKQNGYTQDITTYQKNITNHQHELKELQEEFETVKEKKEALEDKYLQMRVAMERMTDIKAVLNRFFANEDLFDEKMDLKHQQVSKPQINELPLKTQSRLPSRQNRNTTKLKPLNNSRKKELADDDDFWKGDFTAKTRNF